MAMDATTCWYSMRASPFQGTPGGGCRSTRGTTTSSSGLTSTSISVIADGIFWDNTQVLDFDGDGALDLVNAGTDGRLRVFQRQGGVPDQLIRIGNGVPRGRTEISYTTLADRTVHTPGTSCSYPLTCPISGGSVVAEHRVTSDVGTGTEFTWDRYQHHYEAARADLHGRGWLGFAEHTVTRMATGATTVTEFDNVTRDPGTKTYPFAQLPKKQTYTVTNGNDATGREFRSITTYGYKIRRFDSGTYTVEQRHATTDEQERPVGASEWQSLRHTTTTPATTISATPMWSRRPPRAAAPSPRTSTTATTPPPG